MERRTVRIYKAPNGQGEYINKTGQFLKKAQMGAETRSEEVMQEKQIEALKQYVTGALDNQMEPEEIYRLLVSKGVPKEIAYPILTQVMQEMEAPEEEEQPETKEGSAEESKIGQSEFQPVGQENQETEEEDAASDGMNYYNSYADEEEPDVIANSEEEFQDGGPILSYEQLSANEGEEEDAGDDLNDRLVSLADFVGKTVKDDFSDFGKDISEYEGDYTPIEWDTLGDGYGYYKKGGSKKNFTKNVLSLIKKQEGGDAEESTEIGRGNKKDTLTNDVSKIKSSFTDKLKEVSSKAAIDSIYDKMMKSNDPELMQSAQELAQNRQKSSQMGSFEPIAQQGGYIGENQPDMFSQGGFDTPQAQKGFIQKAGDFLLGEKYTTANNPYNAKTGALYKDPLTGLTPVARTVHKRGILGRPKKYTDYYSKSGNIGKVGEDYIDELKRGPQPNHKPQRDVYDDDSKKREYNIPDDQYEKLSRRDKRQERKWAKLENENENLTPAEQFFAKREKEEAIRKQKELEAGMRRSEAWSQKQGMDKSEWWDNGTTEAALPEGLSPEDIEMINTSNAERENMLNAPATEKQRVLETYLNPNSQLLNTSDRGDFIDNWYIPTIQNAVQTREEFTPSSSMDDPGLNPYYRFATGKSKATTKKEAEEEAMRMQMEQEGREAEYEKRYGGLPKAQIGVKSPTNGVNPTSDATAMTPGTGPLAMAPPAKKQEWRAPMLAPADEKDDDSALPDILDPNKFKEALLNTKDTQKDTQEEDDLIAQDVETRRKFNGVNFNNKLNMGLDAFTGAMRGLDQAKQQNEMYANNFNADSLYGASTNKDKGDYVAYGQQTGMFRPNETGQETMGRFAYGQSGGYMQEGGYTEGDEVDMTEEELAEFIANGGEVEYL
jgi:hypothetical protein